MLTNLAFFRVCVCDLLPQVNPKYVSQIEKAGMVFVGQDTNHQRMEILELQGESAGRSEAILCMCSE